MASKRASDLGEKMARMVLLDFPGVSASDDDEVADVLVAIGALAGGVLAGVFMKKGQDGLDACFLRFQTCIQDNMQGTLEKTAEFYRAMSDQREKGKKGEN